ncbi:hypothetical protein [Arthrobacter sedimenti]|uniref:hypothetical protein n=1 Tax=Arthrobacter sedimenti TaxID=2694931 RepID=UPI000B57724A|nr:hypothetical protein [Arthrobacter sedimenti]OUM39884.1 hypothetical protein B8W73_15780 [Arthrobacter agilis]
MQWRANRPVQWRAHWAVQVLAVFVAGRLVSTGILLLAAARQGVSPWSGPAPGYGTFINYWDSGWYERIFMEGYPTELPRDALGGVSHNQWAFYPLYPGLVRVLDAATGLGWGILAPLVSVAAAGGASLVIYRLFRLRADHRTALAGVAVVSFAPVSAILQVPYAESLHLLLLASALYLVSRGRYYAAMPVVVLMCLARPAGVPFAIAVGILFLAALRTVRRSAVLGGQAAQPVLPVFLLGVVSSLGAVAWPLIAWAVTGQRDAYVATETAWRGEALVPFVPWFQAPAAVVGPAAAVLVVAGLLLGVVALFLAPAVRSMGLVAGAWCAGYLLYLGAFWDPQSSTWRILLPLFPLALAVAGSRSRFGTRILWVLLPVSVLLQFVWVDWLWGWTPSGPDGDYPP